jgi:O-succinylbenzoate synthase
MSADGLVTVPLERPGLGVTVDVERIDALTVRRVALDAPSALAAPAPAVLT